jgi:hypothetical protein
VKLGNIEKCVDGWLVGNFDNTLHKTSLFEVGVKTVFKNEVAPPHKHNMSVEMVMLLDGSMVVNGKEMSKGDWYKLDVGEPCVVELKTESITALVIKYPSCPNDKELI